MGLFGRGKAKEPFAAGQTLCHLDSSGSAWIKQQHHDRIGSEAIAVLAPIAAAIWVGQGIARSGRDVEPWRRECREYEDVSAWNDVENPQGVTLVNEWDPTPGAVAAWGRFMLLPTSKLAAEWVAVEGFDCWEHGSRLVGALWQIASDLGHDREVWHAMLAIFGEDLRLDYGRSDLLTEMPQMFLDYAAQQVAIEQMRPDFD